MPGEIWPPKFYTLPLTQAEHHCSKHCPAALCPKQAAWTRQSSWDGCPELLKNGDPFVGQLNKCPPAALTSLCTYTALMLQHRAGTAGPGCGIDTFTGLGSALLPLSKPWGTAQSSLLWTDSAVLRDAGGQQRKGFGGEAVQSHHCLIL